MANKNLYVVQKNNNINLIDFFLLKQDSNDDLEEINKKYNFINYEGVVLLIGNNILPDGDYHKISFDLSDLKSNFLKEGIKKFIEETFEDNINNESEFIELIKNLINFFTKSKKSDEEKFIENSSSFLVFLNVYLEEGLINNNFLINHYSNNLIDYDMINISNNHYLKINNRKNLEIIYNKDNNIIDNISINYDSNDEDDTISVKELFNNLQNKGMIFSEKFIKLKKDIEGINEDSLNRIKVSNPNKTKIYFYDHNDCPNIPDGFDMKKCTKITFTMDYSLCSFVNSDKEKLNLIIKNFFSN